jgi:arylsulfatase A-like enzyme
MSRILALVGILMLAAATQVEARPPNVLVLFADDLRADALGCYGNREVQTPNIDALARRGSVISNAYVMGGMQGAVCVASRAMFLSGRTLFHVPEKLDNPQHVLWPEAMRAAGYRDHLVGKWHNGPASFARIAQSGDALFFGGMSDHLKLPLHHFSPNGKYNKQSQYVSGKFSSEVFADAAIDFLENSHADKPFFLYVAFTSPHDPRMPPEEFSKRYDPGKIELPKNFLPEHPFDNGEMRIRDEQLAPWPRTPEVVRRHIADYYGMISHLDAQIGRILTTLQQRGLEENTIIVFAGDNGLAVGQHGLLGKQNLYEHSVHVPLLFAGPGVPQGKEVEALCYLLDAFPTVCELTGVERPTSVEGRSLMPVMTGKASRARETIFCAYRDVQRSLRDARWKLIRYPKANVTQLFDLQSDPAERMNLADHPEQRSRVETLLAKLTAQQKEYGDKVPLRPTDR